MTRPPRDRVAEAAAIEAATGRLLEGCPMRSETGKLTVSKLIIESGLRRDVVYEHSALVDAFKGRVKAQHSTPTAIQDIADKLAVTETCLAEVRRELAAEQQISAMLRLAVGELTIELDRARRESSGSDNVTRLPVVRKCPAMTSTAIGPC